MKNWKPFFIENSKIPVWLSYFAPINIGAITLFFLVFSRGKMDEVTKRHETIHFQQMLETGVVGFVVFISLGLSLLVTMGNTEMIGKGQKNTRGYEYKSAANKAYHRIEQNKKPTLIRMKWIRNYPVTRPRFSVDKKYKV